MELNMFMALGLPVKFKGSSILTENLLSGARSLACLLLLWSQEQASCSLGLTSHCCSLPRCSPGALH